MTRDEVEAHVQTLIAAGIKPDNGWFDIETAPWETQILVGRWQTIGDRDPEFIFCESGKYHDAGNEMEGEAAYDFWSTDDDPKGVVDSDEPDVWQPLPKPPIKIESVYDRRKND